MFACDSKYDYDTVLNSTASSTSTVNCSPRWIVHHNLFARGGWSITASTQQQCLNECVANRGCLAVEWGEPGEDCWIWINDDYRLREYCDCITQYEVIKRCTSASGTYNTTSAVCIFVRVTLNLFACLRTLS